MQRFLPFAFHGLDYLYKPELARFYNLIPDYYTSRLDDKFLNHTSEVYSSLLQAIAEQDKEYLKNILEPKLYHATAHCMDALLEKKITLQYIEEEKGQDEIDQEQEKEEPKEARKQSFGFFSRFTRSNTSKEIYHIYSEKDYKCNLDVRGVFGVKINRNENVNTRFFKFPKFPITPRTYFINSNNPMTLFENQILVVNVLIQSSKKLIALDEDGQLVHGNESKTETLYHKLRLESYVPNFNWVITDIDDYLKGNPYF